MPGGGDAYLLEAVLHDWEDAPAAAILRCSSAAVPAHGRLLVVEQLLDEGPDPARTAFSDLDMLVVPGGLERDRAGYAALLAAAGFRLSAVVPTGTDVFVLEAEPA